MADDADGLLFLNTLREGKLISDHEFLIGVEFRISEPQYLELPRGVYVTAFVIEAADSEEAEKYVKSTDPVKCRKVEVGLTLAEFFLMFKRFSVVLGWMDLGFVGRDFIANETER